MVIFFAIYLILIVIGIKFRSEDNNFLSFDQTNALKGIGIMTVFFNHIYNGYLTPHGVLHHPYLDEPFVFFESTMTGMFVGMFLFFSGYGIVESVKKKGQLYIDQMPVKRLGTTLFNFDIAVLVFFVANLLLKMSLPPKVVLLSLVGWESIGNSNWYIFAILCCYLFSYISFKVCSSRQRAILLVFLLVLGYFVLMYFYKQPWWYNTIFCYPVGMLYSEYKEKINCFLGKRYLVCFVLAIITFGGSYIFYINPIMYNIAAVAFSFICVLISMKVTLRSQPLIWMGAHLFPLYIFQRLPMFVIDIWKPELIDKTPYLYLIICIIITLLIGLKVPVVKLGK